MINKVLLAAIVMAGWSNYAAASCSTNKGDCGLYKNTGHRATKLPILYGIDK